MQVGEVMTRDVVTVGPDGSAKYAPEAMAGCGFAALPVVDDDAQLVGKRALRALAAPVPGVVGVRVLAFPAAAARGGNR